MYDCCVQQHRRPYGYIRRSARPNLERPGVVSHEQQVDAIRRLATRNGDDPDSLVILEDWGVSGRSSSEQRRTQFAQLERDVRAGRVSVIYAWSINRLARSLVTLTRLVEACKVARVPIMCHDGYSPDVTTSTGVLILNILSSIHKWQADWTSERAREAVALRERSGGQQGPAPYGWKVVDGVLVPNDEEFLSEVIRIYAEVGSYQGTAKRLNVLGIPTKHGGPWGATVVREIIRRDAGGLVSPGVGRGRSSSGSFRLSGLLRCGCGGVLTGRAFRGGQWPAYTCKRAATVPGHPRPATVSERRILPAVRKAMDRTEPTEGALERARERENALKGRRAKILESFFDGVIDRETRYQKLAEVDVLIDKARRKRSLLEYVPRMDLQGGDPREVNQWLRKHVERIELSADWKVIDVVFDLPEAVQDRGWLLSRVAGDRPGHGLGRLTDAPIGTKEPAGSDQALS